MKKSLWLLLILMLSLTLNSSSLRGESSDSGSDSEDETVLTNIQDLYENFTPSIMSGTSPFGSWFDNNIELVSPTSGGLVITAEDLTLPGRDGFDLELIRTYSSETAKSDLISAAYADETSEEKPDAFGVGWTLNVPWISNSYLGLPSGKVVKFGTLPLTYHEGVHFVLESGSNSKGYILTMNDGIKYIFDDAGKVTDQISTNGKNSIHFAFSGSEISEITDSLGREVIFTYKTVGTKRLIQYIEVNKRIIEYDYYDNGLLKLVIDPMGRKTEYKYTCFAGKEYGEKHRFDSLDYQLIHDKGKVIGKIKNYDLYLLESITYPTGLSSIYTYYNDTFSQNFDWNNHDCGYWHYRNERFPVKEQTIGSKHISYFYQMNPEHTNIHISHDIDKYVSRFYVTYKNMDILSTTMVENGGKTIKYNLKHVVKNSGNYSLIDYRTYNNKNYVSPVVESSETTYDGKEFESTKYQYKCNILEPTLEQHLQGGTEKFQITKDYDDWGNLIYQNDGSTGLTKEIEYFAHDTVKNLPKKEILTNKNPVANGESKVIITYDYNSTYLKPETVTVDTGTKSNVTKYTYYNNGNLKTKTNSNGLVEVTEYDQTYNAFPVKKRFQGLNDANGNPTADIVTQSGYNYFGLKIWEMDGRGYVINYVYDDLNRVKTIYLPDDNDTPFAMPTEGQYPLNNPYRDYIYDDIANTCEYWNENRQKTLYTFDGLGRLVETVQINDQSRYADSEFKIVYHYNDLGQVDSVTNSNNHTIQYRYDGLGRIVKIIYPVETSGDESVSAQLDYDDTTNTVTIQQENGNVVVHKKDWANRLVQATQQAVFGTESKTYTWNFQYDALGNKVQQTDPLSNVIDFAFDPLGHLEETELPADSLVYPDSNSKTAINNLVTQRPTTICVYDEMGNKTSETDANGNQTEYSYDALGRLLWTRLNTTQTNISTKATETVTVITKYFYDANGNRVKMVDPNDHVWLYTYSARGFLLSETDPLRNRTRYRYDPMGNKIATIDPRNTTETPDMWYSFSGEKSVLADPRSDKTYTTWYLYDDYNRLYRTVLPDNTAPGNPFESTPSYDNPYTEAWYDLVGNKVTERDPNGVKTTYTYYPRNWVHTKVGPDSKEEYEYDAIGNQTTVKVWTDIRAGTYYSITKNYDSLGRLRQVIKPQGEDSYLYDALGKRTTVVDGNGNTTIYTYNNLGRLTEVADPLGKQTIYRYDPNGNQVATISPNGLYYINVYDEQNRLKESIDSLGQSTVYNYDAVGNRRAMLDVSGTKWIYGYYDDNLLKKLTLTGSDNSTYHASYEYDAAGNRTKVTDTGNVITYTSDAQNRVTSVSRTFDNSTYQTAYQYKNDGRIAAITYPEAVVNVVYKYDTASRLAEVTGYTGSAGIRYYADGLVKSISLANGTTNTFNYDEGRRLQNITAGTAASKLINTSYTYDSANNMLTSTDSVSGLASVYTYYQNNWLQSESTTTVFYEKTTGDPGYITHDDTGSKILDYTTPEATVSLDYASSSIGIDFGEQYTPNVKIIKLIPDQDHQTTRLVKRGLEVFTSADNVHFTKVTGFTFSKDSNGVITLTLTNAVQTRVVKIHCVIDDTVSGVSVNKATFLNTLADMIRVYEAVDGTKVGTYAYDNDGNRKLRTVKLTTTTENKYFYYPDSNRLMTDGDFGYIYDAAGNLVEKGNKFSIASDQVIFITKSGTGVEYWKYEYDLLNRLVKVQKNGATVVEYGYDPEGLRVVKKSTENGTTHYVFDGTEPIYEKQISFGKIRSYIYALGKHLARVDGVIGNTTAKVYYYHTDNVGSIRKITNSKGAVVWDASYAAFGSQIQQSGAIEELHSFTGKELDSETGLYYFNARWYDSELGRFISEDPEADPNNPNLYVYCRNNPLAFIDITGLATVTVYVKNLVKLENATSKWKYPTWNSQQIASCNDRGRINSMVIDYIRLKDSSYGGDLSNPKGILAYGLWTVTAGGAPALYRYDMDQNKNLAAFFSENGSGKSITDPITNIEIDAHHMIATMDGILTYSPVSDEWAGWGGDLQTAVKQLNRKKFGKDSRGLSIAATKIIGYDRPNADKISSFTAADLLADVDAVNLSNMLRSNSNMSLSEAIDSYYSKDGGVNCRFTSFVDSYGGWNNFRKLVHQNSLGPLDLDATKEERAAAEKAFLNYVKKGMNAERYAEVDSEREEWLAEIDAMDGIREDWQ
jgi:RHS repeat-associated protein